MRAALLLAAAFVLPAAAQPTDPEYGLILQEQRTAEFAAGARRGELEALHQQQRSEALTRPGQRARMARDRDALLLRPLPVPGRPAARLDPIPLKGFGG